jgi:hypothetical protein
VSGVGSIAAAAGRDAVAGGGHAQVAEVTEVIGDKELDLIRAFLRRVRSQREAEKQLKQQQQQQQQQQQSAIAPPPAAPACAEAATGTV